MVAGVPQDSKWTGLYKNFTWVFGLPLRCKGTMFVLLFLTTPAQDGILIQNKLFSPQSNPKGKSEVVYLTEVFLALAEQNLNVKTLGEPCFKNKKQERWKCTIFVLKIERYCAEQHLTEMVKVLLKLRAVHLHVECMSIYLLAGDLAIQSHSAISLNLFSLVAPRSYSAQCFVSDSIVGGRLTRKKGLTQGRKAW